MPRGRPRKKTAKRVAVKEWRARALELRVAGWSLRQIAERIGKSISTIHEAIEQEITSIPADGVKQLRAVEGARLDRIIKANLRKASAGDGNASFVVIAAITARAKLFGMNAVEKIDVTASLKLSVDAHHELLARLAKLAGDGAQEPKIEGPKE